MIRKLPEIITKGLGLGASKGTEMDFSFSEEAFRHEIREFLKNELPPGSLEQCMETTGLMDPVEEAHPIIRVIARKLGLKGWLGLGWPREYGGQASPFREIIYKEEMAYHRVPYTAVDAGIAGASVVAFVLLNFGDEAQKREHLARMAAGEGFWCFGYSERGSGSDFASIQCRAEASGDDYIIDGQKIWSTAAHFADWCLLAVRTGPPDSKHRGISLLLVDMKTPGIEVRPLKNVADLHIFNELDFNQVRIPKRNRVGEENRAWVYLGLALGVERIALAVNYLASTKRGLDELVAYAKEHQHDGLAVQPVVRQKLAEMAIEVETGRLLLYHAVWLQDQGLPFTNEASLAKVFSAELVQKVANVGMEVLGLYGQLRGGSLRAPLNGYIERSYLTSLCCPLMGGTSEIQRNIIATRGLGLPLQN